jgi:hypothetical protein
MSGGGEGPDLADFGDDQHRRVAPDAADLAQRVQALVGLSPRVDLAGGGGDLPVEVTDQRHQAVQPPAGPFGQLEAQRHQRR